MISLIIPTYNEADNIKVIIPQISKAMKNIKHEILVVDDDSPDKTWQVAGTLKKYNVRVIRRRKDKGLAKSVLEGFDKAKGDIIGVMDADLSHPPSALPRILKPLLDGKAELVVGSRLVKGGGVEVWPFYRRVISWGATLLSRPLTNVKDPMSGLFFMKKSVIKNMELKPEGYKILLEILVKGTYDKAVEVPYMFRNREVGKSKLGPKIYVEYVKHLGKLYWYKVK